VEGVNNNNKRNDKNVLQVGETVCGNCVHFRNGKCVKRPELQHLLPTARYAEDCPHFEPRVIGTADELLRGPLAPQKVTQAESKEAAQPVTQPQPSPQLSVNKEVERPQSQLAQLENEPQTPVVTQLAEPEKNLQKEERVAGESQLQTQVAGGRQMVVVVPIVLTEEQLLDILASIFKGEKVREEYVLAAGRMLVNKVIENDSELELEYQLRARRWEEKARLLNRGDTYPPEEFIRDSTKAVDAFVGFLIDSLSKAGIKFVTVEYKPNEYEYLWAERSVLREAADKLVLETAAKLLRKHTTKLSLGRVRTLLLQHSMLVRWESVHNYDYYIPLADERILDLEKLTLLDGVEGRFFRYKLNAILSESDLESIKSLAQLEPKDARKILFASIPNFARVFFNVFPEENEKEIERFEEALGTFFLPTVTRHFFLVEGAPNIGKSVLKDSILAVFGKLGASLSVNQIFGRETSRFAVGSLAGKLVNLSSETTTSVIRNLDLLKNLTGDAVLYVEEKFKQYYEVLNRVKMMFFVNQLPILPSKFVDDATIDRFYVIRAEGEKPLEITPLIRNMIMEKERNGILRYLLWCYWRLKRRDFMIIHDLTREEKRDLLMEEYLGIQEFVADECEEGPAYTAKASELYLAYKAYRERQGMPAVGRNTFYEWLKQRYKYVERPSLVFIGLRLRKRETSEGALDNYT